MYRWACSYSSFFFCRGQEAGKSSQKRHWGCDSTSSQSHSSLAYIYCYLQEYKAKCYPCKQRCLLSKDVSLVLEGFEVIKRADIMFSSSDGQPWGDASNTQEQHLYDILTGKYKYLSSPWQPQDLEPDLVLTMKVPNSQNIQLSQFLSLSTYITSPSPTLSQAFSRAQKHILSEMTKHGQNQAETSIKIRLQKALKRCSMHLKGAVYMDDDQECSPFEVQCIHEKGEIFDSFTLQYNAILYTLQRVCGFRVRAFLLYDEDGSNKRIFLFLNLSVENRLRLACKFSIKKEIDYSQIDFFINDPYGKDNRPLKVHSGQRDHKQVITFYKQLSRFFRTHDPHLSQTSVINEIPLNYDEQDRFLLQTENLTDIMEYYKQMKEPILNSHEKQYIFTYNNNKINRGCKLLFHKAQQRKEYFQLVKYLSYYYGFKSTEEPEMFEQFVIPGKGYVGAGYFQRIKAILLYKPQLVGPDGNLDLFLKMEKIKLAYVLVKSVFKINFLQKIGFDLIGLPSQFQLKGTGGNDFIKGGVDGQNVEDSWPVYAYFTNINVVRNYFGNLVGHQISFKIYMIYYLSIFLVPYLMVYIFQNLFGYRVYLETDFLKLAFMAIGFRVYLTFWSIYEDEYVQKFSDEVQSKVFSSQHRGPYIRNMVTDQLNEYAEENMAWKIVKNIMCLIVLSALLVAVGAIFYGCRMFLLSIFEPLAGLQASFFSVPHLIAYLLFFLIIDVFRYLGTDRVINMLVLLQNPASDEDSRQYSHTFRFFYLLGIELIAPFFLLILEPFSGTTCYAKNCINQIIFYVYARYQIKLGEVLIKLGLYLYSKSKNKLLTLFEEKSQFLTFQSRIQKMLVDSQTELDKKNHQNSNTFDIIAIIGYSIYSIMLPMVALISLFSLFIDTFNTRSYLLYQERRPINKSQNILAFKKQLNTIYFIGVLINAWIIVFPFNILTKYFPQLVTNMMPFPTPSNLFLLQLTWTAIIFAVFVILGYVGGEIAKIAFESWLQTRKKNKFKDYLLQGYALKVKQSATASHIPIKSIFRTFNPQKTDAQRLQEMLVNKFTFNSKEAHGLSEQQADTFSALGRRRA